MTLDIDVSACRARQLRLLEVMQQQNLDLVVVTQNEHVQYLAGPRFAWTFQPFAALSRKGKLTLVAPNKIPPVAAADEVLTYEAQWHSTMRNDQREASSAVLAHWLAAQPKHDWIGIEYSTFPVYLSQQLQAEFFDIEPTLYRLRRRKDPDELAAAPQGDRRHGEDVCEGPRDHRTGRERVGCVQRTASGRGARVRRNAYRHRQRLRLRRDGRTAARPQGRSWRAVHSRSRPGVPRLFRRQLAAPSPSMASQPTYSMQAWEHDHAASSPTSKKP